MENVDICIELMRIREFDSTGGRHKLNSITLSYTARGYNTPSIELNWNLIFSARVLQSIRKLISRIRELENFLLRAMENVDICIELVRIREFDSSGGRIELYHRPYFSVFSYNLSRSGKECKGVFVLIVIVIVFV